MGLYMYYLYIYIYIKSHHHSLRHHFMHCISISVAKVSLGEIAVGSLQLFKNYLLIRISV